MARSRYYFHFNKITIRAGTDFQSPELSQRYVRNVCHTAHQYLTKSHFDTQEKKHKCNFHCNAYDDVIDSEMCAFNKNKKMQIFQEQNIFSSTKNSNYTLRAVFSQKVAL